MSLSLRAKRSNLEKYKKEIGWLLKDKYGIVDTADQNTLVDFVILSETENPELKSKIQNPCLRSQANDQLNSISQYNNIRLDIKKILQGEPIDYVIGFREFLNCKIDLSLKPLIPRVETEFWVDQEIKNINSKNLKNGIKILDLCCGSGCIGISILKNIPNCTVTFADISGEVLTQTEINLKLNCPPELSEGSIPVNKYYKIIKSNLFDYLKGQKFDYIFTNPPYVKHKDIKGSLLYEPKLALDGKGADGLEIIYKILEEFSKYLNPNGILFLEFGYGQKTKIEKKIKELRYINYKFKKDQFGKYRNISIYI